MGPALVQSLSKSTREKDAAAAERTYRTAFTLALLMAAIGLPVAFAITWFALPEYRTAEMSAVVVLAALLAMLSAVLFYALSPALRGLDSAVQKAAEAD